MTTWVKVYNSMPSNPKILMAGDRAAWLAVCGLCYSNEHLTNGFIARHALPVVAPGVKNPEALAVKLVAAELWHEVDGGWTIHDYQEHQRSAEEIRERRAKDAARKAESRSNGSPRGQIADSAPDSARNPAGVRADLTRAPAPSQDVEGREQRAEVEEISGAARAEEKITEEDQRLCRLLAERAKERNEKFKVKSRSRWLTDMRLLRERDGNSEAEISEAIGWVFQHRFWGGVIQSPGNLRQHFAQIWDQMHERGGQVVPIGRRESAGDLIEQIKRAGDAA